jgi:hypothetical protein
VSNILQKEKKMTQSLSTKYIARDFMWNGSDFFVLNLGVSVCDDDRVLETLNERTEFLELLGGQAAICHDPSTNIAAIVHCRIKVGIPQGDIRVFFENASTIKLEWPGVRRVFVRFRVLAPVTKQHMLDVLHDDIASHHSESDVELPDRNQTFHPWSDDESSVPQDEEEDADEEVDDDGTNRQSDEE